MNTEPRSTAPIGGAEPSAAAAPTTHSAPSGHVVPSGHAAPRGHGTPGHRAPAGHAAVFGHPAVLGHAAVAGHAEAPGHPGAVGRTPPAVPIPASAPPGTAPTARLQRLLVPAGALASVATAFAYVGVVDPNEPGHYPVCPLLRFTGIYCPGCGGLRSAHAFVHGDFAAAVRDNALAVVGYVLFAVLWMAWAARAAQGRPLRIDPSPAHLWVFGVLVLAFTVVRNLPFGGWLHP